MKENPHCILLDTKRHTVETYNIDWFLATRSSHYKDLTLVTHKDYCSIGYESEEFKPSMICLF